MTDMNQIENAAKVLADERAMLEDATAELMEETRKLQKRYMPAIRRYSERAGAALVKLEELVKASPTLFTKPKTATFHGIKVGYRKLKGSMNWKDDAQVVALIRKHFSDDKAEAMIRVQEFPIVAALEQLPAVELKRLGVMVVDASEAVVVSPVDGELEKAVSALLNAAAEEIREEAA